MLLGGRVDQEPYAVPDAKVALPDRLNTHASVAAFTTPIKEKLFNAEDAEFSQRARRV
jgi:hypothetical protein